MPVEALPLGGYARAWCLSLLARTASHPTCLAELPAFADPRGTYPMSPSPCGTRMLVSVSVRVGRAGSGYPKAAVGREGCIMHDVRPWRGGGGICGLWGWCGKAVPKSWPGLGCFVGAAGVEPWGEMLSQPC